jgi:hypothetical protein
MDMKIRNCAWLALLLAASCMTNQRSDLVIVKVVEAADNAGACVFNTSATELTYSTLNPTVNFGFVAAVVANHIADPSATNPVFRTNTAYFQPVTLIADYEVIGGGATIARQAIPVSGVVVPPGDEGTIGGPILPGALLAAIPSGTFVRVSFYIEGRLYDGSKVKTNVRDYMFRVCTTCTTNACL